MSRVPHPEFRDRVEAEWRRLFGGQSEASLAKILDFEMQSVELHRENLVPLLRAHGVSEGRHLLDFGSGPGCSATAIAYDLGARVTGVEPNHDVEPIARLWPKAYGVEDRVGFRFRDDTLHLPFEDETFDFVLTSSSLEYIKGDRGPYIREMTRVLRGGGRLIVAGTSNAAWPREVHSGTWLLNWMPNLGPKIREYLGRNPDAERGVTFGEILSAAPALRWVRGDADELGAFSSRLADRFERVPFLRSTVERTARRALEAVDRKTTAVVDWPAEAFLPWLNVGFEKRSG